ncbi:hypothetical protein [Bacillus altitudinis]|uniref:hypothetical protein n=1 Tax=Bacillus altitudinis TaxID=293387 RepID=UPI002FFD6F1B
MPIYYTQTQTKTYNFDFQAYLESDVLKNAFGHLSFYPSWIKYWCDELNARDKVELEYARLNPNTNPVLKRYLIEKRKIEVFRHELITVAGKYIFQYDVDRLKNFVRQVSLQVQKIDTSTIFVDPNTKFSRNKINDNRLPILVRDFGTEYPFTCIDGNKRIHANLRLNKKKAIDAYVLNPEHSKHFFFRSLDHAFYILNYEIQMMSLEMSSSFDESKVLACTQMYQEENARV